MRLRLSKAIRGGERYVHALTQKLDATFDRGTLAILMIEVARRLVLTRRHRHYRPPQRIHLLANLILDEESSREIEVCEAGILAHADVGITLTQVREYALDRVLTYGRWREHQ